MPDKPISTRPVGVQDNLLRQKFYESIAAQSDLMDKLGERLLTLELAIPGLYATVVKLIAGEKATITANPLFYATLAIWLVALVLTLAAMIPRNWKVDPQLLRQDAQKRDEILGIEDFFEQSAQYKRRLLVASSLLFFAGICAAFFTGVMP